MRFDSFQIRKVGGLQAHKVHESGQHKRNCAKRAQVMRQLDSACPICDKLP
jgi:hypothetical protein